MNPFKLLSLSALTAGLALGFSASAALAQTPPAKEPMLSTPTQPTAAPAAAPAATHTKVTTTKKNGKKTHKKKKTTAPVTHSN